VTFFLRFFFQKQQDECAPNFFSGFRRKHLFIAIYIEKHCTRSLRQVSCWG